MGGYGSLPRGEMDRHAVAQGAASVVPAPQRAGEQRQADSFLEREHEQLARQVSVMRRVEDLADRLLGAEPAKDGTGTGAVPQLPGFMGAMSDLHNERHAVADRMEQALGRIERVL